eukprot:5723191-Prorocentrum_lima.AAC.1
MLASKASASAAEHLQTKQEAAAFRNRATEQSHTKQEEAASAPRQLEEQSGLFDGKPGSGLRSVH